jgi:hypothetical protein
MRVEEGECAGECRRGGVKEAYVSIRQHTLCGVLATEAHATLPHSVCPRMLLTYADVHLSIRQHTL